MEEVNLPHLKYILTKIKCVFYFTHARQKIKVQIIVLFLSFCNSFVIGLITRQQTSRTAKMLKVVL